MYARRSAGRSQIVDGGITGCGRLASAPGQVLEWGYGRATARAADGTTKTSGGPYVTWWRKAADGAWRIERNVAFAAPVPETADPCLDAVSHAFDEAQFRHDAGAIAAFLSPELVYVRGSGAAADKAAFVAGFADAGVAFDPFVIKDRRVIMLSPDAAVVAGDGLISGTEGGKRFTDHFRYADTFRREGGRWQVAYVQVTRIP
jgi:ketosteroid isomerase-like protein